MSSTDQDQVRSLAERVARRLSQSVNEESNVKHEEPAGGLNDELSAMRTSLQDLQHRLIQIESHLTQRKENQPSQYESSKRHEASPKQQPDNTASSSSSQTRSPWLSGMYFPSTHPSQDKFGVEEAAVSELVDFFEKEKSCTMEPGGKPCDHCAMCSTRGF